MNKSARPATNSAPSIIGSDVTIIGNLSTNGEIQMDGIIEGDVNSISLTVGEKGTVKGTITADEVVVKGKVTGKISGRNIRLEKTAIVSGDLYHETLSIEAGARISGKVSHKNYNAQEKPAIAEKPVDADKPVDKKPETQKLV